MTTRILQGQVLVLFAFDIGSEVSLEKLSAMMDTTPVQPLSRKKQTPTYLQYNRPPQILHLGLATGHFAATGQIQATVFDFGAVSISYRWPMRQSDPIPLGDLPRISHDLYNFNLETHAKEQVESLMLKIEPAIIRPKLSNLVEDYYIFVIEKLDGDLKADDLLSDHRSSLAQTLRFEIDALSRAQQATVQSQALEVVIVIMILVELILAFVGK